MEILKASDLRIGNLVTDSSGFICEIREIRSGIVKVKYHSDKDIYCLKSFSEIFSIKLTEEWLMKFSFLEQKQNWFNLNLINDWTYLYINSKYNLVELSVNNHGAILSRVCQHVHQLQNLYYALTGEELEMV